MFDDHFVFQTIQIECVTCICLARIVGIVLFLAIVLLERYFLSWQSAVETPPETL